jgi:hypothetical protein
LELYTLCVFGYLIKQKQRYTHVYKKPQALNDEVSDRSIVELTMLSYVLKTKNIHSM